LRENGDWVPINKPLDFDGNGQISNARIHSPKDTIGTMDPQTNALATSEEYGKLDFLGGDLKGFTLPSPIPVKKPVVPKRIVIHSRPVPVPVRIIAKPVPHRFSVRQHIKQAMAMAMALPTKPTKPTKPKPTKPIPKPTKSTKPKPTKPTKPGSSNTKKKVMKEATESDMLRLPKALRTYKPFVPNWRAKVKGKFQMVPPEVFATNKNY